MKRVWTWGIFIIIFVVATFTYVREVYPGWGYLKEDDITLTQIDTERKLAAYERTLNPTLVRSLVTDSTGDALSMQVMSTLARWSIKHPRNFEKLVSTLTTQQKSEFIRGFSFAVDDSGQGTAFRDAFNRTKSPIVQEIIRGLGRSAPW